MINGNGQVIVNPQRTMVNGAKLKLTNEHCTPQGVKVTVIPLHNGIQWKYLPLDTGVRRYDLGFNFTTLSVGEFDPDWIN